METKSKSKEQTQDDKHFGFYMRIREQSCKLVKMSRYNSGNRVIFCINYDNLLELSGTEHI